MKDQWILKEWLRIQLLDFKQPLQLVKDKVFFITLKIIRKYNVYIELPEGMKSPRIRGVYIGSFDQVRLEKICEWLCLLNNKDIRYSMSLKVNQHLSVFGFLNKKSCVTTKYNGLYLYLGHLLNILPEKVKNELLQELVKEIDNKTERLKFLLEE